MVTERDGFRGFFRGFPGVPEASVGPPACAAYSNECRLLIVAVAAAAVDGSSSCYTAKNYFLYIL